MLNRDDATKEVARQIFAAIAELSQSVTRLQEQQKTDVSTLSRYRKELDEITLEIKKLGARDYKILIKTTGFVERLEFLENYLSADMAETYLQKDEFEQYKFGLLKEKMDADRETLKKFKETRWQIIAAIAAAFSAFLKEYGAMLWEFFSN